MPVALGGVEDSVSPLGPPHTEDAMYSCLEMNTAAISAVVHLSEYGTRVLKLNGITITGRIAGKYVVGARKGANGADAIFAFDPDLELHRDIGELFGVVVAGGGHVDWGGTELRTRLYGRSLEFGPDPDRTASQSFLKELFSDWKIYTE
jgi:hypothetical protein